ncbi:hypothetical protein OF83DRAFT_1121845 [Amylostereum chailletii]|nr:hypothetical protein OF83DRAFT_1121845 [Amylostereum chailletii]
MPQSFVPPNPISSIPGSTPPAGVDVVPPPWDLNARMWTFPFKLSESLSPATGVDINPNNTPDILQGLPAGSYPPGEKVHPSALSPIEGKPQQSGDNAAIIIVRYESTPAGPYDELIMSASFNNPETKQVTSRITNIYVSTANSVWNGRRNWNIAKYLARFEFEDTPEGSIMRVFHHERSPEPFSSSTKPQAPPHVFLPRPWAGANPSSNLPSSRAVGQMVLRRSSRSVLMTPSMVAQTRGWDCRASTKATGSLVILRGFRLKRAASKDLVMGLDSRWSNPPRLGQCSLAALTSQRHIYWTVGRRPHHDERSKGLECLQNV